MRGHVQDVQWLLRRLRHDRGKWVEEPLIALGLELYRRLIDVPRI